MECNKEEARRAMDIAEMKLSEHDYNGAKKFINKAQNLYPTLDGLKQFMMMIDVYISASNNNNGGGESDWYGILGVHPSADDETMKKQYKNLARLLHPDKNRFYGAECAFKLVLDAWSLLSDHSKRIAYDQKRKPIQVQQKKSHEPATCNKPEPASSSLKESENVTVWIVCDRCTTRYSPFVRNNHINQTFPCPNCGQDSGIHTEMISGTLFVNFSFPLQKEEQSSANSHPTSQNSTSDANSSHGSDKRPMRHTYDKQKKTDTSSSTSSDDKQKKSDTSSSTSSETTTQVREKRSFQESRETPGNANEPEKPLKKLMMTTTIVANSTDEAKRLFKSNPMTTTIDANSTDEATRLFKNNPMTTTIDANSTDEAKRLFKNF